MNLKQKASKGLVWSVIQTYSTQVRRLKYFRDRSARSLTIRVRNYFDLRGNLTD